MTDHDDEWNRIELARLRAAHDSVWGEHRMPHAIREGITLYIDQGIQTGAFVGAVLSNDLRGALGAADLDSAVGLPAIVAWLHNHAPSACWGSPEKVAAWKKHGGFQGLYGQAWTLGTTD